MTIVIVTLIGGDKNRANIISGRTNLWDIGATNRLGQAHDVHFFYTRSNLSALQNCTLIFSTNFQFIFTFKHCTTQFSH